MTGIEIQNPGDGIWDDGEWISSEWINSQAEPQAIDHEEPRDSESVEEVPLPSPELLFRIEAAKSHPATTLDPISPDWGAIGEKYCAEAFGVALCRRHAEGHDGWLDGAMVEVKTITPHKRRPVVLVKRSGCFNLLAVVRITPASEVDNRFIRRKQLTRGNNQKFVVSWSDLCRLGTRFPPS